MDAVTFSKANGIKDLLTRINKLVDIQDLTPTIGINTESRFNYTIGGKTNRCIIKGVYVEGAPGSKIHLQITGQDGGGFLFYENEIDSNVLYDIIDLPYIDDDSIDKLHIKIENTGTTSSTFKIRITAVTTL